MRDLSYLDEVEIARRLQRNPQPPSGLAHAERFPEELFPEPERPAAVLVPFIKEGNHWHILFTRRVDTLPEHSGQVAFPGGRADDEDASLEETALREAYEEIGLPPENVYILGKMPPFQTITNYRVTPVVGVIQQPFEARLEPGEVSRVFTVPLHWLAEPSHYEIRERPLPPPYPPVSVIYFQPYDGETLWGVSAYIVLRLLEILGRSPE